MAFMSILVMMAAIIGIIIAILGFLGVCLLVIGGTGIAMNRKYAKLTQTKKRALNSVHNAVSIILGSVLVLFPVGYLIYGIISVALK
ncbi:hypothetical protein AAFA46_05545 [Oscillospiraceae bacterium WX1]